ncbi:response regulator [Rivularia sp. UHCC 0363]|uniref:response regulator n=1 Tax=Rivularia sp. UHCC 0363 TaxID=3110244 RepID=UPI002B1EBEEB|nr:response regulator [Rivularia sp. UHCC 0363]MEA5598680.1 response regulator [Rivularia sp. UHCC 0363]
MKLAYTLSMNKNQVFQPPLILVVEDNEDHLLLISYILESLDCRIITQKDGETTVLLAKEYCPDLILLDVVLPKISGIDILRSLRKEPLTCDIPAIAVTALATEENRENMIIAGFNDCIFKPYMIEELEQIIIPYIRKQVNFYPNHVSS